MQQLKQMAQEQQQQLERMQAPALAPSSGLRDRGEQPAPAGHRRHASCSCRHPTALSAACCRRWGYMPLLGKLRATSARRHKHKAQQPSAVAPPSGEPASAGAALTAAADGGAGAGLLLLLPDSPRASWMELVHQKRAAREDGLAHALRVKHAVLVIQVCCRVLCSSAAHMLNATCAARPPDASCAVPCVMSFAPACRRPARASSQRAWRAHRQRCASRALAMMTLRAKVRRAHRVAYVSNLLRRRSSTLGDGTAAAAAAGAPGSGGGAGSGVAGDGKGAGAQLSFQEEAELQLALEQVLEAAQLQGAGAGVAGGAGAGDQLLGQLLQQLGSSSSSDDGGGSSSSATAADASSRSPGSSCSSDGNGGSGESTQLQQEPLAGEQQEEPAAWKVLSRPTVPPPKVCQLAGGQLAGACMLLRGACCMAPAAGRLLQPH